MQTQEWQDGALYAAIWGGAKELFDIITVDDFDEGPRRELASIIERGMLDHATHMNQWVIDEATRLGRPKGAWIADIIAGGFTASADYYGKKMREESSKRYILAAITRAHERITKLGWDAGTIADELRGELEVMPVQADSDGDTWTIQELMSLDLEIESFTIPNMLRRNERLVLTGSEGGGKSVFVYQMLTGAAYGIDTFTHEQMQPQRVLFIDVENNEFQARANLDKIVPTLSRMSDVQPEWRSMKRRVVNLLDTKDKTDVIRRVVHYAPDILYMGTAYKLTDVTDETHRSTRAIQSVVDRIRQEIDCSVIVEHHAGHGFNNDRNNMRPEGSSYWLRWPDFGYGMQPLPDEKGRLMRLRPWRGDRADDRVYPVALKGGSVFPWQPVYADEWEAIYSPKYDN